VQLYEKVFLTGNKIMRNMLNVLLGSSEHGSKCAPAVAINTLPWPRSEVVQLKDGFGIAQGSGTMIPVTPIGMSYAGPRVTVEQVSSGVFVLQNDLLRVKVEKGLITSLFDRRHGREVIEKGKKANQFLIFDDKPLYWQAWDVEVYHLDTGKELAGGETHISENSPHVCSVVTKVRISEESWLTSTISLGAAVGGTKAFVECRADVEWHETMKFLKVEFPVEVRNTEASYETAFGITRRPTHYNTTWDMAKFEVCCHRWADLSEPSYGVSILNDSKYGFSTCGNLMRLSLLRAPKAPDAHADMGKHKIRWAIFPHEGAVGAATVRTAYEFNNPMRTSSYSTEDAIVKSLDWVPVTLTGHESLILDTIKRGEDDEDVSRGLLPARKGRSVVLRIYESIGSRSRGVVQPAPEIRMKRVFKSNILEDDCEEVSVEKNGTFSIELRPFEVATFRLELHS
jgi:alpha-mannosidase